MHYYSFNIGDYTSHTAHLSPVEDIAYRRLLDLYYQTELPIPNDIKAVCRQIRMRDHADDVQQVLSEFFTLTEAGWGNKRCDEEIAKYIKAKSEHWACVLTPAQRASTQAARNAAKTKSTPPWLTKEDKRRIEAIYQEARDLTLKTGIPHEVDHVVPLRGKTVCGLHVAWNLRAIPAYLNRSKSNTLVES